MTLQFINQLFDDRNWQKWLRFMTHDSIEIGIDPALVVCNLWVTRMGNRHWQIHRRWNVKEKEREGQEITPWLYRAWLKDGPQVAWMLQARPVRRGKHQQQPNSPNLENTFYPIPVLKRLSADEQAHSKQSWQLEKPQSATEHPSEAACEAGRVAASKAQRVLAFFKLLNCFHPKPGWFCTHHSVSYVKKIPVVCTMGGSKDFAFTRSMTELSSVKVPTLTLGHPV